MRKIIILAMLPLYSFASYVDSEVSRVSSISRMSLNNLSHLLNKYAQSVMPDTNTVGSSSYMDEDNLGTVGEKLKT